MTPPPTARTRVLFVDDEPNVLEGLRNVLRSKRHEWEMFFALGPEAALERIEGTKLDVVVSDMRMPKIDGAAVLERVKALQPKAVRIILSGQTEIQSIMRSVFVAHLFLSKPCDHKTLEAVVDRARKLSLILNSEELRAAAGRVDMLPGPPEVYVTLNQALARPECTVQEVVRIIQRDVGLCAKLLQLVNSAFFGLSRRLAKLDDAVNYLGLVVIKNLALALQTFSSAGGLSAKELKRLEDHSLLTGQIARRVFASEPRRSEEAFLAGMLHEVGRLVELANCGDKTQALAASRPMLGAYLLGLWGLPHPIVEAVALHEAPQLVAHDTVDLVDVVHVADYLAAELMGEPPVRPLEVEHLARVGFDTVQIENLRNDAQQMVGRPAESPARTAT